MLQWIIENTTRRRDRHAKHKCASPRWEHAFSTTTAFRMEMRSNDVFMYIQNFFHIPLTSNQSIWFSMSTSAQVFHFCVSFSLFILYVFTLSLISLVDFASYFNCSQFINATMGKHNVAVWLNLMFFLR